MGKDGLRHTPQECLPCLHKTHCLRAAIQSRGGLAVKEEHLERSYNSGMVGFLERWSKKKTSNVAKKRVNVWVFLENLTLSTN